MSLDLKKIIALLLVLGTTHTYSQTSEQLHFFDERLTALEETIEKKHIYNSSGRAEVENSFNLFLTGDYLYLVPQENGLAFGIKTNDPTFSGTDDHLNYKNIHFQYDFGFRGGVGYNIPHDAWDLYAYWTHFNTNATGHSHAKNGSGIFPLWSGAEPTILPHPIFAEKAEARLRLNLNIFDLELGREYYVGKWVTLRPSLGIRTGFIHQHYHITYSPLLAGPYSGIDDIYLKNEYWGVGPKAGIDSHWTFFKGFSVYGSATISMLFGDFDIHRNEQFTNLPIPSSQTSHNFQMIRAITDLAAGLAWDIMLAHEQYHLGLRAGYEQHLYFGQNQFEHIIYNGFSNTVTSNLGDLSLSGWTLSLRIDF